MTTVFGSDCCSLSAANCCSNSLRLRSSLSAFVLSASTASDYESDFDAITSLSFSWSIKTPNSAK